MRRFPTAAAIAFAVLALLGLGNVDAARASIIMKIVNMNDMSVTLAPPAGNPVGSSYQFQSNSLVGFSDVLLQDTFVAPTLVPPVGPGIDLGTFTVLASTGGTLDVFVTLTDLFAASSPATLDWTFSLTKLTGIGAAVSVQSWVNPDNTPFGTPSGVGGSPVTNYPPVPAQIVGSNASVAVPVGVPFSMTIEVKITLPAGGSLTSGDFSATISTQSGPQIQENPEPASLAIWGLGLALAGGARCVRRKRTAG